MSQHTRHISDQFLWSRTHRRSAKCFTEVVPIDYGHDIAIATATSCGVYGALSLYVSCLVRKTHEPEMHQRCAGAITPVTFRTEIDHCPFLRGKASRPNHDGPICIVSLRETLRQTIIWVCCTRNIAQRERDGSIFVAVRAFRESF